MKPYPLIMFFLLSCSGANIKPSTPIPNDSLPTRPTAQEPCASLDSPNAWMGDTFYNGKCWRYIVATENGISVQQDTMVDSPKEWLYQAGKSSTGGFTFPVNTYDHDLEVTRHRAYISLCGLIGPSLEDLRLAESKNYQDAFGQNCKTGAQLSNLEYIIHNPDGDLIFTFNSHPDLKDTERLVEKVSFKPK